MGESKKPEGMNLVWFVRLEDLPIARAAVKVGEEAYLIPDEGAFAALLAARSIVARAYPLDKSVHEETASILEFNTGMNADEARRQVGQDTPSPEGAAHLLRLLTHHALLAIDYTQQTYLYADAQKNQALINDGGPVITADAAYSRLVEEGLTPFGAADVLTTVALKRALQEGVSPWKFIRMLLQHLAGVLDLVDVTRRTRSALSRFLDRRAAG